VKRLDVMVKGEELEEKVPVDFLDVLIAGAVAASSDASSGRGPRRNS
jgi:hypothetical protein